MIFLRRILTVALGFLLLAFLLPAIVSCQISATVLSADFYKDRLSSSDFYRFVTTDLPFAAIGELRRSGSTSSDLDEILHITSGISDQEVVSSLNRVMPPDRFQNIIEQALDEIVPYIAGDRDEFTFRVELKESADTLVEEVRYLLRGCFQSLRLVLDLMYETQTIPQRPYRRTVGHSASLTPASQAWRTAAHGGYT